MSSAIYSLLGFNRQSEDHQEMIYHDVKVRTRSDSIYSEFHDDDEEPVKLHGAATFASYMNLTNTCIGAVS